MALLITGSMGHVGFEAVRQAAARGLSVVAQYRGTFRELDAAAAGPGVRWVKCDLADEKELNRLVASYQIDSCLHSAAVPNESFARPDPLGAVRSNVAAVASLLEHARKKEWRRFILVSTGSVIQNADDITQPIYEDRQPFVTNIYSTTKYCAELLVAMYRSQFGLSAASVRISWVYGPPMVPRVRENPRGPIPWFLKQALAEQPIVEPGGSDFAASFTHVADVAAGLLAACHAETLRHPVYHLGWGKNFTTGEVVDAVRKAVPGARIGIGPGTAPWTDHTRMRGPLAGSRLAEDTGFEPNLDLDRGVSQFADWMRANRIAWATEVSP